MGRPRKEKSLAVTVTDASDLLDRAPSIPMQLGGRQPIQVKILQFKEPGISGPGLGMATSCSIKRPGKPMSRHTIEYHPWYRAFLVTYTEPNKEPISAYIPEHCVVCWYPV